MKTITKTLLAAVMLLIVSCKKENTTIKFVRTTDENLAQTVSTDVNEPITNASIKLAGYIVMKKNLNVSFYRNGDRIPQVKDPVQWNKLTTGAWCWYNNDSINGAIYGKLYNWYAVNDPRGLAPAGWHIPGDTDWIRLSRFLGGAAVAGGKMKEPGTAHWLPPNTDATNSSGFTGLPGGWREHWGPFEKIGDSGYWWSSTESGPEEARFSVIFYYNGSFVRGAVYKLDGLSVRCIKD